MDRERPELKLYVIIEPSEQRRLWTPIKFDWHVISGWRCAKTPRIEHCQHFYCPFSSLLCRTKSLIWAVCGLCCKRTSFTVNCSDQSSSVNCMRTWNYLKNREKMLQPSVTFQKSGYFSLKTVSKWNDSWGQEVKLRIFPRGTAPLIEPLMDNIPLTVFPLSHVYLHFSHLADTLIYSNWLQMHTELQSVCCQHYPAVVRSEWVREAW